MIIPIKLKLSNAYLVRGRKPILIDTGASNEAETIIAAIRRHGLQPTDIALILHTHGHSDHAGSTVELKTRIAAPTAIHPADLPLVDRGHHGQLTGIGLRGKMMKPFINPRFPAFKPDILLETGQRLDQFGIAAQVIHTPGHTAGSISLLFDDGQAIIGDMLMGGYLGGNLQPGKPNTHYFADDLDQNYHSLHQILALSPTKLHVGHGGPLAPQAVELAFQNKFNQLFPIEGIQ